MSPISFAKFLVQTIGEPETCKRLHNGNYLVKCTSKEQSDKFLSISHIGDIEVDTFPHERLNAVKGVITSENLSDNSDEEVLEWLTRNGFPASSIYRFPRKETQGWTFRQRETLQRTFRQTAVITFQLHKLPMEIDIALEKCKVRPYIPNPQRCFRCQRYGHVNRTCKSRHEVCPNCGSTDHVNSQENPCTASSKCVNCQGDHPAYSRGCPKWKIEKKVQEIKVTQAVTFPEARRIAEGLVGQPTYANVSKISLQQSQPSNNPKQSVHTAQTSTDTTLAGPRSTPLASHGPSRSSPTGPRSAPRSSPRRRIHLDTDDGSDVIRRPFHHDPFPEYSLKVRNLRESLRAKTLKELQAQEEETKKRKQQDEEADVGTPAKVPATENDSEYEDFFNNTANSEISSGEEDPMDQHPTKLPPETEEEAHSIAHTSTNAPTPVTTSKSTSAPDKRQNTHTLTNNPNRASASKPLPKNLLRKTQCKDYIIKEIKNVHGSNILTSPHQTQKQNTSHAKNTNRLKTPLQRPNFRT